MRIGRLSLTKLHRAKWYHGFRLSWTVSEFPPKVRFLNVEVQW